MDSFAKSEEDLDTMVLTQSFWDIRNYRKVVRRVEDGSKLSTDLMKMIQEMDEIESKYIRHLQHWAKKWDEHISKSSEYGTLESGWKALFLSASRVADVHEDCHKKLTELLKSVSEWRTDYYHKSISGRTKETKKAEEGFQKAQKPWEKNFDRTNKAKKMYHQFARELELSDNALRNAVCNPAEYTQEQIAKLRERSEKAEREMEKGKRKYQEMLDDLSHHKRHYIEDMEREFDKCQAFEKIRMDFFKDIMMKFKETINFGKDNQISCIYQVCAHSLSQINPEEDLQWYNLHCGTGMPYTWPEFEEYIPESMRGSNHPKNDDQSSSVGSLSPSQSTEMRYGTENHIYERTDDIWQDPPPVSSTAAEIPTSPSTSSSVSGEGELLRALYDYMGGDDDDLTFSAGDIVRVVEYCDGGWAKAFLGDQYGYVPSSYLEHFNIEQ